MQPAAAADTSALINIGIGSIVVPAPDLVDLVTSEYKIEIPQEVHRELADISQYPDLAGDAAQGMLRILREQKSLRATQVKIDPTVDSALDVGEQAAISLANHKNADKLFCDEFKLTKIPRVSQSLSKPSRLYTTPELIATLASNGKITKPEAWALVDEIGKHRSWNRSPFVQRIKGHLKQP